MIFIGIDLAWSRKNPTGAAIVHGDGRGGELVGTALLGSDDEIAQYIGAAAGAGPAIVAIDAPLSVPNTSGRRPGEQELGKIFAQYQAGAHPANRSLPVFRQGVRGEELVQRLEAHNFIHKERIEAGVETRQVIEVYPHAAMVALFELGRTLKYKAKSKRSIEARRGAWGEYQRHLNQLAERDPPLYGQDQLTGLEVAVLRGRRLKDYEDRVDALMCAYTAMYGFRWGMARCRVFGTLAEGYIFTPAPRHVWEE